MHIKSADRHIDSGNGIGLVKRNAVRLNAYFLKFLVITNSLSIQPPLSSQEVVEKAGFFQAADTVLTLLNAFLAITSPYPYAN